MSDERRFNQRGGPSLQHKLRVIVGTKQEPIVYGITIPAFIAQQFSGCLFRIHMSGNSIVLESGCKITIDNIDKDNIGGVSGMRESINKWGEIRLVK